VRELPDGTVVQLATVEHDPISTPTGDLPAGLLRSRILTPDDYTFTPKGELITTTISGDVRDSSFHFTTDVSGGRELSSMRPIITINTSHFDPMSWANVPIPTDINEIKDAYFNLSYMRQGATWFEGMTLNIGLRDIEPITTAEGFDTYKLIGTVSYSDFEFDWSIYIGARPSSDGNTAYAIIQHGTGRFYSTFRAELKSGTGRIDLVNVMLTGGLSKNTFLTGLKHKVDFTQPLEDDVVVDIWADITTTIGTPQNFEKYSHFIDAHRLIIDRPRTVDGTGYRSVGVAGREQSEAISSRVRLALSKESLTFLTRRLLWGDEFDYLAFFGATSLEVTLDAVRIEVISRTTGLEDVRDVITNV